MKSGKRAALSGFALLLLAPGAAFGETKTRECAAAAESAQLLRNSGKLLQAKEQLLTCAKSCPPVVQVDCGQWLTDVDARLPSVVVRARDGKGREVTNVHVMIDGVVQTTRLDGIAIPIDPGTRRFVFDRVGSPTVEENATIREGEKARRIDVVFADAREPERRFPTSAIVLGGVGVLALGSFAVYHFSAKSDLDTLRSECAPRCPEEQVDAVDRKIFVANVSLGIGIAAILGAAFVFFVDGPSSSSKTTGRGQSPFLLRF